MKTMCLWDLLPPCVCTCNGSRERTGRCITCTKTFKDLEHVQTLKILSLDGKQGTLRMDKTFMCGNKSQLKLLRVNALQKEVFTGSIYSMREADVTPIMF